MIQPIRQPVIAQFFEKVLTNRMRSPSSMMSRKEAARLPPKWKQRVDLVGDDPQALAARQVENGAKRVDVGRPAGRVGRRVDEDHLACGRSPPPRCVPRRRTSHWRKSRAARATGRAPAIAGGGGEVRPGRRQVDRFVAAARRGGDCHLDGVHAAAGDKELVRVERTAEMALVIARQRLAQLRNSALPGVEGLAAPQAARSPRVAMNSGVGRSLSPDHSGIRPGRPRP